MCLNQKVKMAKFVILFLFSILFTGWSRPVEETNSIKYGNYEIFNLLEKIINNREFAFKLKKLDNLFVEDKNKYCDRLGKLLTEELKNKIDKTSQRKQANEEENRTKLVKSVIDKSDYETEKDLKIFENEMKSENELENLLRSKRGDLYWFLGEEDLKNLANWLEINGKLIQKLNAKFRNGEITEKRWLKMWGDLVFQNAQILVDIGGDMVAPDPQWINDMEST